MSQKTIGDKTRTRGRPVPLSPATDPPTGTYANGDGAQGGVSAALVLDRLEKLESAIGDILTKLSEVKAEAKSNAEDIKARAAGDADRLVALLADSRRQQASDARKLLITEHNLCLAELNNKNLMQHINDLENRSRACNIKIDGKAENETENLQDFVGELIRFVNTTGGNNITVVSAYRIGRKPLRNGSLPQPIRPRPILVTFSNTVDRNAVYYSRTKLKDSECYRGIYLNDDVTVLTRKHREDFRSVAALARTAGAEVRVHGDGVVLDGKKFRYVDADLLPPCYTLAKAKTVKIEGGLYFHSEHSFLSNFHHSPIVEDGIVYSTAEHKYQATKCQMAGDTVRRDLVIQAPTPLDAKRLADTISESPEWRQSRQSVMDAILDQKFDQNPHLKDQLLATGSLTLHEATTNAYFGIGATLHSKELRDKSYKGMNKLGLALQAKRDGLRLAIRNE